MDDSEPARAALEHALAMFPDDEIRVIHVVDDLEAGYGGGRPPVAADSDGGGDADEPSFFADIREVAAEDGRPLEATVIEGSSPTAILEHGEEIGADQIVMGSEGRSGVSRMLLGSVAEGVTRRSTIPVTIVPRSRSRSETNR
ncbi:UspA domain-containing protein [Natronolimnohabitans innermongolicus JCM 12255]|uniref:UspA domain-containing protein n=2 Tax=Natronolimnohabitans innermongolicus TaxID=253107 RepID=L9X1B6_9EURY|nr:UspA domain-containing protein [Natronolimnohabitans innermongolicus JCM 12255]